MFCSVWVLNKQHTNTKVALIFSRNKFLYLLQCWPLAVMCREANITDTKTQLCRNVLFREKSTERTRSLSAAARFVVSPASGPVNPRCFIRLLRRSAGAVGGQMLRSGGTLKLVREGGESGGRLLSPHILYFHSRSGDLNRQPSGHKPAFYHFSPKLL